MATKMNNSGKEFKNLPSTNTFFPFYSFTITASVIKGEIICERIGATLNIKVLLATAINGKIIFRSIYDAE